MSKVTVEIVNKSNHRLPEYATPLSSGLDLKANIDEPMMLGHEERTIIPTGLYVAIPEGYEIQIRPRSGLAAKRGITVLNAPGTIDADFRGEIGVILYNTGDPFLIEPGERIAQAVLAKVEQIEWSEVTTLSKTERGEGGFGSTGTK